MEALQALVLELRLDEVLLNRIVRYEAILMLGDIEPAPELANLLLFIFILSQFALLVQPVDCFDVTHDIVKLPGDHILASFESGRVQGLLVVQAHVEHLLEDLVVAALLEVFISCTVGCIKLGSHVDRVDVLQFEGEDELMKITCSVIDHNRHLLLNQVDQCGAGEALKTILQLLEGLPIAYSVS